MKALTSPKTGQRQLSSRVAVLVCLLVLVGIGAVPGYWTGNWPWAKPPDVPNLGQIRSLRESGLVLPGWQTLEQKTFVLGGHRWSSQVIQGDSPKPSLLLLLPQSGHKSQPQVEWVDIRGFEHWQTDSQTRLQFQVATTDPQSLVEASFFRAWNQQRTVAVLQWYAWPGGGNPSSSRWFWMDQLAQLRRQRVPWVAVCLELPMEPLGDLEVVRPLAESLGKTVQTALMVGPLARTANPS